MTGVKIIRARTGPFVEQHYYEDAAFEEMAMAELSGVGLLPERPEPVRVDRFIEKRFGIVAEYVDLPAGVMGCCCPATMSPFLKSENVTLVSLW